MSILKYKKRKKKKKRPGAQNDFPLLYLHIECYSHFHLPDGVVDYCFFTWMEGAWQSLNSVLGAETETSNRWRRPTPVTLDVLSASNFNKKLFLTNFFSRETLLLITVSLSCNEVQVFKDGLEKYSQLIKVYFAPEWVLFPTCSRLYIIIKDICMRNSVLDSKPMVSIFLIYIKMCFLNDIF